MLHTFGGQWQGSIGLRVLCYCMETLLKHLIDFCTRTATATAIAQPKSFSLLITGGRGREANFLIALKSLCVAVKYIAYTTRHLPFMHAHARMLAHTHTHQGSYKCIIENKFYCMFSSVCECVWGCGCGSVYVGLS